ncbi:MAG TPA: helix-turn-helix domain-containing protein [Patescibacteria group bacterium]|nr:helix-turn-helix domain-containing protein [Patescibacteria group bacterium]
MASEPIERRALRVEEAAEALGISRAKAFQLCASGELRSFTVGRSRRITPDAIKELIKTREAEGQPAA